MTLQQPKSTK